MKCNICGKEKKTVVTQPSRSQLIFGGFPVRQEPVCQRCDTILSKKMDKILENLFKK